MCYDTATRSPTLLKAPSKNRQYHDTGEQPGWRQLAVDGLPLGRSQGTAYGLVLAAVRPGLPLGIKMATRRNGNAI